VSPRADNDSRQTYPSFISFHTRTNISSYSSSDYKKQQTIDLYTRSTRSPEELDVIDQTGLFRYCLLLSQRGFTTSPMDHEPQLSKLCNRVLQSLDEAVGTSERWAWKDVNVALHLHDMLIRLRHWKKSLQWLAEEFRGTQR